MAVFLLFKVQFDPILTNFTPSFLSSLPRLLGWMMNYQGHPAVRFKYPLGPLSRTGKWFQHRQMMETGLICFSEKKKKK